MPRRGDRQSDRDARLQRYATPARIRHGGQTYKLYGQLGELSPTSSDPEQVSSSLHAAAESNSYGHIEHINPSARECQLADFLMLLTYAQHLDGHPSLRTLAVKKAALEYNNVLRNLGSTDAQLQSALLSAAAVSENNDWQVYKPTCLTPVRLAKFMSGGAPADGNPYFFFSAGTWAGKSMTFAESTAMASQPTWPVKITPVFVDYEIKTNRLADTLEDARWRPSRYDKDQIAMCEDDLTALFSDYWALNMLLTFHQYADEAREFIVPFLSDAVKLSAAQFVDIAGKIDLSYDQLQCCMVLRQRAEMARVSIEAQFQLTSVVAAQAADHNVPNLTVIRQAVAEWERDLDFRRLEAQVVHALLFEVLTPLQTAKFMTWIRKSIQTSVCQWKEWMRLIFPCICGEHSWMDTYGEILDPMVGLGADALGILQGLEAH